MTKIEQFNKKEESNTPQIAYPANMNTRQAEFADETSTIEKQEGVNDRKYDKNKKYDEDKEPECPDDTSTVEMEEGVIDRKDESKKI